jgi:tetratricopeptide (TPR) repeat protein
LKRPSALPESWLLAGILAVTALAFANAIGGTFVYDDRYQVVRNPTLSAPGSLARIFTESVWQFMASSPTADQLGRYYRPLFSAALIVQHRLFGLDTTGWHLVSIAVHLLATFLVHRLARAWGLEPRLALAAALLFGLHPLHSESVAWISGIPDPMAAVFLLGALLLLERVRNAEGSRLVSLLLAAVLGFLAMLCKETAFVLPVVVLARALVAGAGETPLGLASLRRRALPAAALSAPFVVAAGAALILRYRVLGAIGSADPASAHITGAQVLLTLPAVVLSYLKLLFFPFGLSVAYDLGYVSAAGDPRFFASLGLLAVLIGGALWLARASAAALASLAILFVFIGPVLNLKALNDRESLLHDRYLYIPSIGFCLLVALALGWAQRVGRGRAAAWGLGLLAGAYLALTIRQNTFWRDDVTLAGRGLAVAGPRPFLYNLVGVYHFIERNDLETAAAELKKALDADPACLDAMLNLAEVRRSGGRLAEAEDLYRRAIGLGAQTPDALANLGLVCLQQGRLEEAEPILRRALARAPEHTGARYNLAWAYQKLGRLEDSEREYREVTRRDPSSREAWINLGILLAGAGRLAEAEAALLSAGALDPGNATVLYHLAEVLRRQGRCPEAIKPLLAILAADPRHGPASLSLGLCDEAIGKPGEARAAFRAALANVTDEERRALARERLRALGESVP